MSSIHLHGTLRCRDTDEAAVVASRLPAHLKLTREEPGCLEFEVLATDDPLVWSVEERFADAAAFRSHQQRVAASAWGRATAGIERLYDIEGL
ncbi:antibiotic biosynthesis monooxygenase [Microbacterium protaetiae]|uniref:Antibiotic biosynthesis monooxygenase n=1 Tax=Microbacterium protaetiae TaxID=2509458 RepID=A0A4P6EE44_9MICO|nr:antibiotic biosynthesis monooxygenase [Microbacterium protaetiae]QAY59623.1 antibiotic biosynthesis monooxygenase [Microbacterium protaetiae]